MPAGFSRFPSNSVLSIDSSPMILSKRTHVCSHSDFDIAPIFGTFLVGKNLQKVDFNSFLDSQTYTGSSQITTIAAALFASSCCAKMGVRSKSEQVENSH